MNVIAYYRGRVDSMEQQRLAVTKYVSTHGDSLVGQYTDLESAINSAATYDSAALMVASIDRLSREVSKLVGIMEQLESKGVKLVVVNEPDAKYSATMFRLIVEFTKRTEGEE